MKKILLTAAAIILTIISLYAISESERSPESLSVATPLKAEPEVQAAKELPGSEADQLNKEQPLASQKIGDALRELGTSDN